MLLNGNIVSGSDDGTIHIWDSNTGKKLKRLEGHTNSVSSLLLLPNGNIVSGSRDGTIRMWDSETGKELKTFEGLYTRSILSLLLLPNGNIVSGSRGDNRIRIWDSNTGKELKKLEGHTNSVKSLLLLPNGNIVAGSADLRIWGISYGVADLEQAFSRMSAKQAKKVWELLKKLKEETMGLKNIDNEHVIKAEARKGIIEVLKIN